MESSPLLSTESTSDEQSLHLEEIISKEKDELGRLLGEISAIKNSDENVPDQLPEKLEKLEQRVRDLEYDMKSKLDRQFVEVTMRDFKNDLSEFIKSETSNVQRNILDKMKNWFITNIVVVGTWSVICVLLVTYLKDGKLTPESIVNIANAVVGLINAGKPS